MIGATSGGDPITRGGARDAARHELSKGIYHRNDEAWPLRVFNAVHRWIEHVLRDVSRHAPGGGAGALGLLLLTAAVVGVVWWRVGLVRRTVRSVPAVLDDGPATSGELLRAAETAAADGRWDDAVIARTRALAMVVEERGLIDPRPGRTADELAAEVAAALPSTAAAMRAAAGAFDAVAYGRRPAAEATYDVVVTAADAVSSAHRQRRGLAGARS